MSGRFYAINIDQVAVSAIQDLFGILATANMAFRLWRVELGQRTLTAWESKPIKFIRNPATVTAGTGGSAATPQKENSGDAAATVTARINDVTTQQSTNGAASILFTRNWELLNGFLWVPRNETECPVIAPSQGLAINFPVAPSASMTVSGSAVIEELF